MNLTRADVQRLGRKRLQPVKGPGELLAVFVAGRLVNPLNERQSVPWFAGKQARYKRQWKARIALAILEARASSDLRFTFASSVVPKRVDFLAIVPKKFDSTEGLRAAMKAFPDALKECGVIDDDRDSSGHDFVYDQLASRKREAGVEIRVSLRCAGYPGVSCALALEAICADFLAGFHRSEATPEKDV